VEPALLVSVVVAAYNRSNVLRIALESVRRQTFADWEVRVVGDACTDDSEQVVASLGDPRIHFTNLEHNVGEQSGPNNEGTRQARGRLIAYLGQDDLWLPDHLELGVRMLEKANADFVFSLAVVAYPSGDRRLIGATTTGRYEPWVFTVPSTWLMRRDAVVEVGGWRSALELHTAPQEDLLARLYAAGKRMVSLPALTVVKLNSTEWPNTYRGRDATPQEAYARRILDEPDFRERELTQISILYSTERTRPAPLRQHATLAARDAVKRIFIARGLPPYAMYDRLRFRRRGGVIDDLRAKRGLEPLDHC
jgi:glycosyltransferase involved in cell wall biosynthesis